MPKKIKKLIIKFINKPVTNRFTASSSLLGKTIDNSNFKVAKIVKMNTIEEYKKNTPNISFEYIIVSNGVRITGIICTMADPENNVKTYLKNSFWKYFFILFRNIY